MKKIFRLLMGILIAAGMTSTSWGEEMQTSAETEDCLGCHAYLHPGLVDSWKNSRHSRIVPAEALKKEELERRISASSVDGGLENVVVGCYECHSLRTDEHGDAFEHNGYTINVIVSPADCATCHPTESEQYSQNIMSHAHGNLVNNELYADLMAVVNNHYSYSQGVFSIGDVNPLSEYESCLYCHGTKVSVTGRQMRETDFGDLEFPILEGWPNQGVGRINPDGSKGACTSCHTRHGFAIEEARKPHTCSECHKGPDVPAYKVYEVSKHGTIFKSKGDSFDYTAVPWQVGRDFTVPTCAVCHASLVTDQDGEVVAERSHRFNDRLAWRLFGVPYAHPHPIDADLQNVVNSQGLPLAVELDATPVARFVLNKKQQKEHTDRMKAICSKCHSSGWVNNHFRRLDNTIETTNKRTKVATDILMDIWQKGYEQGLPQGANIFDEEAERRWTSIWLFYANSTRFASAMAGGGDYGVFAKGRYQTTEELTKLLERLKLYQVLQQPSE